MAQRDRAHDRVDGVVRERHVVRVRLVELAAGNLLASAGDRTRRAKALLAAGSTLSALTVFLAAARAIDILR